MSGIKVGPFTYTVETVLDLRSPEGVGCWGYLASSKHIIQIEQEMIPERAYVALWHEVLHAVDDGYLLGLGEQGVGTLGMVIVQLLQDNPALLPVK